MEYANIELSYGSYSGHGSSNAAMGLLSGFLQVDVGIIVPPRTNHFLEWLNDPTSERSGGNETSLYKDGDNVILIDALSSDLEPISIEIPKEQFRYILTRWEELTKKKPKEILLTRDGDTFTLEAIEEDV